MATVKRGFLLLADLTGYTAYLARGELAHAPVIAGDLLETVVGRAGAAVPAGQARRRCRVPVRRGRARRAGPAARRDRGVVPGVPSAAAEHRGRERVRLQGVRPRAASRPQGVRPPRRLPAEHDRRPRRALGRRRHRRPPAAQGRRRREAAGRGFVLFTVAAAEALGLDRGREPWSRAASRSSTSATSRR